MRSRTIPIASRHSFQILSCSLASGSTHFGISQNQTIAHIRALSNAISISRMALGMRRKRDAPLPPMLHSQPSRRGSPRLLTWIGRRGNGSKNSTAKSPTANASTRQRRKIVGSLIAGAWLAEREFELADFDAIPATARSLGCHATVQWRRRRSSRRRVHRAARLQRTYAATRGVPAITGVRAEVTVAFPSVAVINTTTLGVRQTADLFKLGVNYKFERVDLSAIAAAN